MVADRRRVLGLGAMAAAWFACGRRGNGTATRRCASCGMHIADGSHWEAGATGGDGQPRTFDTPGCLFRFRLGPQGHGTHGEWVTEFYGPVGVHRPAREVRFARGSDVTGPMGPDLVPVDPGRATTFLRDHHATELLAFDGVSATTLEAL